MYRKIQMESKTIKIISSRFLSKIYIYAIHIYITKQGVLNKLYIYNMILYLNFL